MCVISSSFIWVQISDSGCLWHLRKSHTISRYGSYDQLNNLPSPTFCRTRALHVSIAQCKRAIKCSHSCMAGAISSIELQCLFGLTPRLSPLLCFLTPRLEFFFFFFHTMRPDHTEMKSKMFQFNISRLCRPWYGLKARFSFDLRILQEKATTPSITDMCCTQSNSSNCLPLIRPNSEVTC